MADQLLQVEVKANQQQLKDVRFILGAWPKQEAKVLQRAVNKVGVFARNDIVKTVREDLNVKAGDLKRKNVTLQRADRVSFTAHIRIKGGRIPLEQFGARQTRKGITYTISKSQGRKRIATAFKRNDKPGIWRRIGGPRTPITRLHGPSVPVVVDTTPGLTPGIYETALVKRLEKEIETQVRVLLERGK